MQNIVAKRDAIVSDDLAQKFATEKDTPYLRWVRDEGLTSSARITCATYVMLS